MARKTRTTRTARVTRRTPAVSFPKLAPAAAAIGQARATVRKAVARLVKQGTALEASAREAAIGRVNATRDAAVARAEVARASTVQAVNHLEKMFEQRVSKAISKLGVPTTKDVRALSRQVAQLQASVDRLSRSRARA